MYLQNACTRSGTVSNRQNIKKMKEYLVRDVPHQKAINKLHAT